MQVELAKRNAPSMRESILNYLQLHLTSIMPPSPYREFYLWAFSDDNPHQELWIETTGILQFSQLAYALLDDLVEHEQVSKLSESVPPMTLYLLFETISDNMAFGSAPWSNSKGHIADIRREFLISFNNSMVNRISNPSSAPDLSWYPFAKQLSSLSQSMNAEKQHLSIQAYLDKFPGVDREEIEFGGWSLLAANIETCVELLRLWEGHPLHHLLRETLIQRYDGVNRLLVEDDLSTPDLLRIGTHTILVPSVLAYYSAVLSHIKGIDLASVFEEGLLERIFNNAALLIRLLNDVGASLLLDSQARCAVPYLLKRAYQAALQKPPTFFELVMSVVGDIPELTRLYKDIEFGEFNISLHHLVPLNQDIPKAVDKLGEKLHELAEVYDERYQELMHDVTLLESRLGDPFIGALAVRFVKFHEKLYANSFLSNDGEYAV